MKYLESIFDDMPGLGLRRPGPSSGGRTGIDLDEDLFSPGPGSAVPAPITRPRSRLADAAVDLDNRPWPTLEMPAPVKTGPNTLERKIAEQERELSMRCTQVADLYNLQERQAAELELAHAEIEKLNAAFAELQVGAAQHAATAAERKKMVTALYQENALLRSKLETAQDEIAAVSNKMLTVETMFNDREMVITTTLEQADLLKAQLASAAEENDRLSAAFKDAEQLREDDRTRSAATIEELNRKVESLFADHSVQFKTRDKLAKRCDELARTAAALERANEIARAELAAQGEHTRFLETVLRAERDMTDTRIEELTDRLEQEQLQRAFSERASTVMRQEMAVLLRHIDRQRTEAGAPGAAEPQQDAA